MNEVKKILEQLMPIEAPWEVASVSYVRDVSQNPRRITIELAAKKGQLFPCPECGQMNKRHDEKRKTWKGLDKDLLHCETVLHADVPRINCPEHGIRMIRVPWAHLNNRQPGKVYVTGHRIFWIGPVHLAIEYTYPSGDYVTFSAGLESGSLVSHKNLPSDCPDNNFTIATVTLPQGVTAEEYVKKLEDVDRCYCDCADYDILPSIMDGYNSNSYVRGLLESTGGSASVEWDNYFGGSDPLPLLLRCS